MWGFLWVGEGVFMGANGGLLEKVTRGFFQERLETGQREAGIEPSFLRGLTNLRQAFN